MAAKHIPLADPAHDPERQGLRFLVDGLPEDFTVYSNGWLVEPSGVVHEIDAVVVAPHAVFVVEIKSYRSTIEGTDYDWYVPEPIRSPVLENRKTAQILHSLLKRESHDAGRIWVQGLVFLSAATSCGVRGAASRDRIHTRRSILPALQERAFVERLAQRPISPVSPSVADELHRVLTSAPKAARPARRVREYEILGTLETHDHCTELLARHSLSGSERVLRIYSMPPLASEEERESITKRARWEAQVLGRLGKSPGILHADPPFLDEVGIVLPLERFAGVTLTTWLDQHGPRAKVPAQRADLAGRLALWLRIAETIRDAHEQGVVHRLLRPDAILVEDSLAPSQVRITGFDLAKQLAVDTTVSFTSISDDRLRFAAPEVVSAFSNAVYASDQFSLGTILALLASGSPLFSSTRELMSSRRLVVGLRDVAPRVPLSLDQAAAKMLSLRVADRFGSLSEAIEAVRRGLDPQRPLLPNVPPRGPSTDPDDFQPRQRVGPDYEIVSRLGQGGMAVVYAARHLPSGRTRALKIARVEPAAEQSLRDEHRILSEQLANPGHPAVVRVLDLSNMVEGRLTLIMERVGGQTLRQRLAQDPPLDPPTQRRYAEDLLAALDYLEQKGVTHKDLKPDNLLVGDAGLTVIDFSLAAMPADAAYGGTALYRDPSLTDWTHGSDRYAAALCLFELYAGRHAFNGRVPEPGQAPSVRPDDIDPSGLASFFAKALHAVPEQRFPSARAMRDALLLALGERGSIAAPTPVPDRIDANTVLRATPLSPRAIRQLSCAGIHTVGELLTLGEAQVRALNAIGTKSAGDILAFQAALRARGIAPTSSPALVEPAIVADLSDSPEPIERLALPNALRAVLDAASLPTIGAVAGLTRSQLRSIEGIGPGRTGQIVEALHRYRDRTGGGGSGPTTLDALWARAAAGLSDRQRTAVERFVGVTGDPEIQGEIAREMRLDQSSISNACSEGIERLDAGVLADALDAVEQLVEAVGGVAAVHDVGRRLEEQWPPGGVTGAGLTRVLVRISAARLSLLDTDGVDGGVLVRPVFDKRTIRAFVDEAQRLARQWPPIEAESARKSLAAMLPEYTGDPLVLATRLCTDVDFTEGGQLFIHPLEPKQSIGFVLDRERTGVPLDELQGRVRRVFGERCPFPEPDHVPEVLRALEYIVKDGKVVPGQTRSIAGPPALPSDPLPPLLGAAKSAADAVRELLRDAASSRGFRMLVTPPEHHVAIGRSVAAALEGTWVSFEDAFFERHGAQIDRLERAEQYAAQKGVLGELVEELIADLLEKHGRAGHTVILGDTALLGLCDALDVPRRLYDDTLSGSQGFWVLVVPGVIHDRQPFFNEGPPLWHLEGVTLPLLEPLSS